jgi:hypothetical protein
MYSEKSNQVLLQFSNPVPIFKRIRPSFCKCAGVANRCKFTQRNAIMSLCWNNGSHKTGVFPTGNIVNRRRLGRIGGDVNRIVFFAFYFRGYSGAGGHHCLGRRRCRRYRRSIDNCFLGYDSWLRCWFLLLQKEYINEKN